MEFLWFISIGFGFFLIIFDLSQIIKLLGKINQNIERDS